MKFPHITAKLDLLGKGEISVDGTVVPVREMVIRVRPNHSCCEVSFVLDASIDCEIEAMLAALPRKREPGGCPPS